MTHAKKPSTILRIVAVFITIAMITGNAFLGTDIKEVNASTTTEEMTISSEYTENTAELLATKKSTIKKKNGKWYYVNSKGKVSKKKGWKTNSKGLYTYYVGKKGYVTYKIKSGKLYKWSNNKWKKVTLKKNSTKKVAGKVFVTNSKKNIVRKTNTWKKIGSVKYFLNGKGIASYKIKSNKLYKWKNAKWVTVKKNTTINGVTYKVTSSGKITGTVKKETVTEDTKTEETDSEELECKYSGVYDLGKLYGQTLVNADASSYPIFIETNYYEVIEGDEYPCSINLYNQTTGKLALMSHYEPESYLDVNIDNKEGVILMLGNATYGLDAGEYTFEIIETPWYGSDKHTGITFTVTVTDYNVYFANWVDNLLSTQYDPDEYSYSDYPELSFFCGYIADHMAVGPSRGAAYSYPADDSDTTWYYLLEREGLPTVDNITGSCYTSSALMAQIATYLGYNASCKLVYSSVSKAVTHRICILTDEDGTEITAFDGYRLTYRYVDLNSIDYENHTIQYCEKYTNDEEYTSFTTIPYITLSYLHSLN